LIPRGGQRAAVRRFAPLSIFEAFSSAAWDLIPEPTTAAEPNYTKPNVLVI
jgi:hypothetical protein